MHAGQSGCRLPNTPGFTSGSTFFELRWSLRPISVVGGNGASGTKFYLGPAWASSEPCASLICFLLASFAPRSRLLCASFKLPFRCARTTRPAASPDTHSPSSSFWPDSHARCRPPHGLLSNHMAVHAPTRPRTHRTQQDSELFMFAYECERSPSHPFRPRPPLPRPPSPSPLPLPHPRPHTCTFETVTTT